MSIRKKYAVVGVGGRSKMFTDAITLSHKDHAELVAICDNNAGRLNLRKEKVESDSGGSLKTYADTQFDQMIADCRPDTVVVTTRDSMHDHYICRAMEAGCDVVTEKPMTIDENKCQHIIDVQKKTGKKCTVTFNYRYSPPRTQIKDLLMSGVIGNILSVDFQWLLDTVHGADYFRRWHRNMENSGGLLVHKSTHHFDLVNWWLSAVPKQVFATGARKFYTPRQAERYGLKNRAERCHTCPEAKKCSFELNMAENANLKALFLDNESHDGYFRDKCVFADEIDIYDTMQVLVTYNTGAVLNYSLNAFMPWEGYRINFNGTKGRLEHVCQETVYINGDGSVPGELVNEGTTTKIFPHFQTAYGVELWTGTGGHGGGDAPLLDDIFSPNPPQDTYYRAADQRSGAYSILSGVAANRSIERGTVIVIDDLVKGIGLPEYPSMPSGQEPIEMKKDAVKRVGEKTLKQTANK